MGWEGIDRESGMDRYTLLTRTYCIAHGTLLNPVEAWMGGKFGGEWIHVYVRQSPFTVHLI